MMRRAPRHLAVAALLVAAACVSAQSSWRTGPEQVAPGIELYKSYDQSLLDPPGPVAVYVKLSAPK